MKALAIVYHDVVEADDPDASGFRGSHAAMYKLERAEFERHLASIRESVSPSSVRTVDRPESWQGPGVPVFLTFDDGGASALDPTAGMLEEHGWRGHFFITTDLIGVPAFLNGSQIRALRARGHVVGSHSRSHPTRMSSCTREQLRLEWGESVKALSDLLGEAVTAASVPGGYYSRKVAETAAEAGLRVLFTSEPTARCETVDGCLVVGRYRILRGMPAQTSGGLAAGRLGLRLKQEVLWNSKKAAKMLGGGAYVKLQKALISRKRAA